MTDAYYRDDAVTLYHGDCRDVLPTLADASADAVVTDPPYELQFMGRVWDSQGIAYDVDVWREALRVLKPGGHLLAFGGTRTVHRMTCAIEDAGFEIRDGIDWLYAQGFPKSLDVARAIDKTGGQSPALQARVLREARKRAGMTREQVAAAVGCKPSSVANWEDGRARAAGRAVEFITPSPAYRTELADLLGYTADERSITGTETERRGDGTVYGLGHSGVRYGGPSTDSASTWSGWGTALKPAREPIVVARKPLDGTVAANVLEYGTGALNIDGCRVATNESTRRNNSAPRFNGDSYASGKEYAPPAWTSGSDAGRWPTNVVLSHAGGPEYGDLCANGCVPGCPVAELDAQSGVLTSGTMAAGIVRANTSGWSGPMPGHTNKSTVGDSGSASRFFPAFRYEAKAPSSERPKVDGEAHATVKPLDLMQWLVRLVTPPGGTVLDPFLGSGTTAEACLIEGFRCVGVELEASHLPLIMARLSKPLQPTLFADADPRA